MILTKFKKKIYLKKKAQVSAPFEVLIAIILMGFVIIAGSAALKNLSENTCIGNKVQDLSEFKSALRDVVLGSDLTFKTISFESKACFNQRFETVKLVSYNEKTICSAYCQGSVNSCLLLEYVYNDGTSIKRPIDPLCMDLPTAIEFENNLGDCVDTSEENDWIIISPNQGGTTNLYTDPDNISSGVYRVFKKDIGSSTKVCLLKKKRN
jgi:hypothetical protein